MGDLSATIEYALAQQGKRYSIAPNRFGPHHFDCSGLTWTSMSVGGFDPPSYAGVSSGQLMWGFNEGTVRGSVAESVNTFGDLLIRGGLDGAGPKGHVAFSLGDGRTMEAMGTAYGCRIGSAYNRNWSHGMKIPGGASLPPAQEDDDLNEEQDARLRNVEQLLGSLQNAISDPERGVLATTYKNNERLGEMREKVNALYNYVVKNQFGVTVSSVTNETLRVANEILGKVSNRGG